jgi:hypothetical protein
MSIAPGMGRIKDPGQYPVVLFPAIPRDRIPRFFAESDWKKRPTPAIV